MRSMVRFRINIENDVLSVVGKSTGLRKMR